MAEKTEKKTLAPDEVKRRKEREKFERERAKWKQREAKQRGRKSSKRDLSLLFKIVAVAVSAAIVLGLASLYAVSYGIPARLYTAVTVGDLKVSEPEWAFYFYTEYTNFVSTYGQYAAYGDLFGLGFDFTKSPFEQEGDSPYPVDEDDKEGPKLSWEGFFSKRTNSTLQAGRAAYAEAVKAGVTLSDEDKATLEERMEEVRQSAQRNAVSISALLRMQYAPGVTERFYRKFLERELVVNAYQKQMQEEWRANYTDDMLQKEYNEDPSAYDQVDLRVYPFPKEKLVAEEGESEAALQARQAAEDAKARREAEQFLAPVWTTEAGFIAAAAALAPEGEEADPAATLVPRAKKADLVSKYQSEELAAWAFDPARQAGDSGLVESDTAFYAVYTVRAPYAPITVNYYTINAKLPEDIAPSGEEDAAEKAKAAAKETADKVYADWKAGGANQEAFVAIIQQAAREAGDPMADDPEVGMTKAAKPSDNTDESIKEWLFAPARKAGDCKMFETKEGYTLIFFSAKNKGDYVWKSEIADKHVREDSEAYLDSLGEKYPVKDKKLGMNAALKTVRVMCDNFLLMNREALQGQAQQ